MPSSAFVHFSTPRKTDLDIMGDLQYLWLDSCHPFFPSVQNLYRSLSERSQSSWLLTWWQRLWMSHHPRSMITTMTNFRWLSLFLPWTTGRWGRGRHTPQAGHRRSRPRSPGTCSEVFLHETSCQFAWKSQTNIAFICDLVDPQHPSFWKDLDIFGELGRAESSWDERVCFLRPHLREKPLSKRQQYVWKYSCYGWWWLYGLLRGLTSNGELMMFTNFSSICNTFWSR